MYEKNVNMILGECREILLSINKEDTDYLVEKVLDADKVFFIGVGRVLLSLKSVAKRWAHLGIDTHIVGEITEPAIKKGDILIAASGSGESIFPKEIAKKAKQLGAEVIMIGSNRQSTLAGIADYMIRIPTNTKLKFEDEIRSKQIMTSLFEQSLLLYGDIIAQMIVEKKNVDISSLWEYHANLE